MAETVTKVEDDSMTIAELRLQCEKQLQAGKYKASEGEAEIVSERVRQDKEHVLQPFTLMAHRPNYILIGAYNSVGYDSKVYQEAYGDPSLEADVV